ncbi:MAG: hypothetical protein ABL949_05660 [Fimbriimonadaceae bacterium]
MPKLIAPRDGITVRFYRIGHGDCFLLAMPKGTDDTAYVLIDCGYKPGSQAFVKKKTTKQIVDHLFEACGGHLDLVVITHEHQDHVNGFWKKNKPFFEDFTIGQAWFAWTESPTDPKAIALREKHRDQILGLIQAYNSLALRVGVEHNSVKRLRELISLEVGEESDVDRTKPLLAADADPAKSINKQGMKLVRTKSVGEPQYFKPGGDIQTVPGTNVKAYVLGPPYDETAFGKEDPVGAMAFPEDETHPLSFSAAALEGSSPQLKSSPFAPKFHSDASSHYGVVLNTRDECEAPNEAIEVEDRATWRQIEEDWLFSSENLALALNTGINNTSLALAFEMPITKKILLFVGDAQLGNWLSWKDLSWATTEGREVTVKDIFGRTVLYKVGHHGSHNATLNGAISDVHPNLSWMAQGKHAQEFTAMITAVRAWALTQDGWNHPLPSIKEALLQKSAGRVLQTDSDFPSKPEGTSAQEWARFTDRFKSDDLFFDYTVFDSED